MFGVCFEFFNSLEFFMYRVCAGGKAFILASAHFYICFIRGFKVFIRIKSRLNKSGEVEYAYLVSNSWRKRRKTPKQKVSKYLGKIYRFDSSGCEFQVNGGLKECLIGMVSSVLLSCGFKLVSGRYWSGECFVDLAGLKVYNDKGRSCVVMVNDGYICNWSLKQLFKVEVKSVDDARYLAKVLRLTGIDLGGEDFVDLYNVASKR